MLTTFTLCAKSYIGVEIDLRMAGEGLSFVCNTDA